MSIFIQSGWGAAQCRGRILGHNWDKSLKCFPPCYSQSPILRDFIPHQQKWFEHFIRKPQAEFLDIIGTKVLSVFLLAIYSHLYLEILSPTSKSGLNILYGNLKSENSQDYAQKPQQSCTFMKSASVQASV